MFLYPLTRQNRITLARAFATVPRVDISIDCVIQDQMGKAYVNSLENPQHFMIELDGFFCYLAGNLTSESGRAFAAKIPASRMIMPGTEGWYEVVKAAYGEQLIPIKRYSYDSNTLSIDHLRQLAADNPHTPHIQRIDAALAAKDLRYISTGAFESPEDFVQRGIGFCLLHDEQSIGGAYASLVHAGAIEVSIIVDPDHYRRGIATALCCQLLLWCLENHVRPNWDAANEESCYLAEKLGYTNKREYDAFYLK